MTKARILADLGSVPATLTATELGYSDGVTSAIQTQLTAKAPTASPTFTGNFTSVGIDDNADANAITIDASENVELSTVQYVKNSKSFMIHPSTYANASGQGSSNDKFKAPCDCKIIAHSMMKVIAVVAGGAYNQLEIHINGTQYTNNYGDGQTLNQWVTKSSSEITFDANDEVNLWTQAAYGPSYGTYLTLVIEITAL